ncbi:MAG: riboflavin synthase subunit alpha [Pseudomonadales bacterium]|nr:riboflavin synthase subunit alpha [Pseudomonadales bacterium]
MFTGIVRGAFPITSINKKPDLLTYGVQLPADLLDNIALGASVNIDGVCQTVAKIEGNVLFFDASTETLRLTTLSNLKQNDKVHVERSAKASDENGGHLISGHIDGKVTIKKIAKTGNELIITMEVTEPFRKYLFNKGFVALQGCSLTVCDYVLAKGQFEINLIPETVRLTGFGDKKVGDELNLEVDRQSQVLVDTIERTLEKVLTRLIQK